MMRWQGKVVWITGASSGIGEALALALGRRGARLILSARNAARLAQVRAACQDLAGAGHLVLPLDLAESGTLAPAAERALAVCGRVDVLIHNAAVSQRASIPETLPEVERRIIETDFLGPVTLTRAVLPSMLARRQGRIVVVSSISGRLPMPRNAAYSAAKHALHGYFGALRVETWRAGLRVTIVCPGPVRTEISLNALRGDGSRHARMDPAQAAGISARRCAEAIVTAVERGRHEVLIGGGRWLVHLARLFPELYTSLAVRIDRRGVAPAGRGPSLDPPSP